MAERTDEQESLLEKGQMALRAMQMRKKAAEYQAIAAELEAAIHAAEHGDNAQLIHILDDGSHSAIGPAEIRLDSSSSELPLETNASNDRVALLATESQSPAIESEFPNQSPWTEMQEAAKHRRERLSQFFAEPLDEPSKAITSPPVGRSPSKKSQQKKKAVVTFADSTTAKQLVATVRHRADEFDWQSATTTERLRYFVIKKAAVLLSSWFLSLLAHVVLVIVLVAVAVTVSQDQERVAVVASGYETEEVLLETPLEEPLEMETEEVTDIASEMPQLNSNLADSLDTPTLSSDVTDAINGEIALANETVTGGAISEMLGTAMSAQQLSGASFFGAEAAGNTFVYLVDSSGSMKKDGAFEYAKNELMRSLSSMEETQRFYVIFFDRDLDMLTLGSGEPEKYPIHATKENLAKTAQWIQRVRIDTGAPPLKALTEAFTMEPDGVFLLFDGVTTVDILTPLRKENRVFDLIDGEKVRVPIHTVCFFNRTEEGKMRQLAKENGGTYQFVPNPNELP